MASYTLRLDGTLTAVSPLATTPPNTPTGTPAAPGGHPPSPLPRMTVKLPNLPNAMQVPYIPGGGLRGALRRHAVNVIRAYLSGPEDKPIFTVEDYYYLVLGNAKRTEDENKADIIGTALRRAKNPIIGLFGAGAPWHPSCLCVSPAIPLRDVEVTVIRGVRIDDFMHSTESLRLLTPDERERYLEMARHNTERSRKRPVLQRITRELKSATDLEERARLTREKSQLEKEIAEHDTVAYSSTSMHRPLDGYEAIPAGTVLSHSFTLRCATEHEIGLFLAALDFWSLDPFIGARRHQGCGIIQGEWTATLRQGMSNRFETVGTVRMEPFNGLEAPADLKAFMDRYLDILCADPSCFDFRAPAAP